MGSASRYIICASHDLRRSKRLLLEVDTFGRLAGEGQQGNQGRAKEERGRGKTAEEGKKRN